ncbi:MAG: PEP-utilizing enzyme [Candidatus Micrarchaeota archaeon]
MQKEKTISLSVLLQLAEKKNRWEYLGRWVQPTLSMCFWPLYTKRKSYLELGLPKADADNIQLDGHYIERAPNQERIERIIDEALEKMDDAPLKHFVHVANMATRYHLNISSGIDRNGLPVRETLARFFASMNELIPPWIVSIYYGYAMERAVAKEMSKLGLSNIDLAGYIHPSKPTMLMRQEREAREFADYIRNIDLPHIRLNDNPSKIMGVLNQNHSKLAGKINAHLKEFEWMGTHHCWGEPLTMERLFTQIKESAQSNERKDDLKKLPKRLAWLIRWLNELGYWRQYCAETSDVGFFKAMALLRKAGKELGLKYDEIIWLSDREILKGLYTGSVPSKKEIRKRERGFGYAETIEEELVFTGKLLKKLVEIHVPKTNASVKEFAGTIGSRGFAVGKAFVASTPQEAASMKKGQILVVPQTTPDYVVIMKRAAAIVTDEGGITCHAAIISRELKIPCIVGSKAATRVLKTGDMVEVDAEKGIVRKLQADA